MVDADPNADCAAMTLELDGLTRTYGDRRALDGLTFTVGAGRLFGFVGPNGAGKTTAMRIVLGVLEPDGGAVRFDGRPLDAATRARFGYMPEERGLYPKMRIAAQLAYLAELHGLDRRRAREATASWLGRLGLADRADDRLEELSLGNQQRVQLAAALVHDPVALVLDEPFSGLDPVGVDVMAQVLRDRAGAGVPVVFSSHQLELVERLCDDVAIVKDGRVVAEGAVAELRARGGQGLWRVAVDADDEAWIADLPGAEVVERADGGLLVRLEGARDQELLDRARAAGRVRSFGPAEPTLADLFRKAIT
jgi:ABC-2 type transport system ATP-binding protein